MNSTLRTVLQFPLIKIIAGIAFCMGTMFMVKTFIAQPLLYAMIENKMVADAWKNGISFTTVLISYWLFARYYERTKAPELSTRNILSECIIGLLAGFSIISLAVFILYLMGYYKITFISLQHYSFRLFTLLLTAALIEDLLIRGLIIRVLENWIGTYLTILVGMLLEIQHIFNPNVSPGSIFMFLGWGFTMTMLYVYSKRIWLPFFFHVGWNFAQPFYGSNLTGLEDMGKIIHSQWSGPVLLTGGKTGIEDSLFTIILLYLTGMITLYFAIKTNKIKKISSSLSNSSNLSH